MTLVAVAGVLGFASGLLVANLVSFGAPSGVRPARGDDRFADVRPVAGAPAIANASLVSEAGMNVPGLPGVSARRELAGGGRDATPATQATQALFERLPVGSQSYDGVLGVMDDLDPAGSPRWVELVPADDESGLQQVEYSFDVALTRRVLGVLDRGRVSRGHVIVLDPRSGRVLAYVSTDPEAFPPDRSYPAASLIKVVTAAAALHHAPAQAREPCVYRGNQYRLTRAQVDRPKRGHAASLERALATSNNQCFAQLAVHTVGGDALVDAIARFGWLEAPAPGHSAGRIDRGDDDYDLGRLGCGLSGCRITAMHAAQLAGVLATGEMQTPWWIDRVLGPDGRERSLPRRAPPRRVMSERLTEELRSMLVRTTTHGTARSAFRDRRGRPKLGPIKVAGKTGNLSGRDPDGRYEWFIGAAPAADPTIAIAVLQLQSNLWWSKSSEIAADVLAEVFCAGRDCEAERALQLTGDLADFVTPILLSEAPMH